MWTNVCKSNEIQQSRNKVQGRSNMDKCWVEYTVGCYRNCSHIVRNTLSRCEPIQLSKLEKYCVQQLDGRVIWTNVGGNAVRCNEIKWQHYPVMPPHPCYWWTPSKVLFAKIFLPGITVLPGENSAKIFFPKRSPVFDCWITGPCVNITKFK